MISICAREPQHELGALLESVREVLEVQSHDWLRLVVGACLASTAAGLCMSAPCTCHPPSRTSAGGCISHVCAEIACLLGRTHLMALRAAASQYFWHSAVCTAAAEPSRRHFLNCDDDIMPPDVDLNMT